MNKTILTLLLAGCMLLIGVSCKTKQNATTSTPPPTETIDKSQIMALLRERKSPAELEAAFLTYKLKAKGQTSRTENRWIFTYDGSAIGPDELLEKLRAFPAVMEASFLEVKTRI